MTDDRKDAMKKILYGLRNPLVVMSVPDREDLMSLASKYNITATELLEFSHYRSMPDFRHSCVDYVDASCFGWCSWGSVIRVGACIMVQTKRLHQKLLYCFAG